MMYFVNDNYKTTRPVISSFDELMNKNYRNRFNCQSFILIGEYDSFAKAVEAFNNSDLANNSRYYGG